MCQGLMATDRVEKLLNTERWTNTMLVLVFQGICGHWSIKKYADQCQCYPFSC